MSTNSEILRGQRALLSMQMFSTMGFSVLYSTLVLYTTQGLDLESHYAVALTGGFIALNYALHLLGGYIGGRLLSYRSLFLIGMLLQAIGAWIISLGTFPSLILGCSTFLSGCGLNMICINCMLTQLFDATDKRRESAFLWNYSGMNFGFFIGFTVSGLFQLQQHFAPLFIFASVGSVISLVLTLANWRLLKDKSTIFSQSKTKTQRRCFGGFLVCALIGSLILLLRHANISNDLIGIAGGIVAGYFIYISWKESSIEKSQKIRAFLILTFCSVIFWTLYQMAPMGITLFFERNVHHFIGQYQIPPQWLQNINTIVIIFGGPTIALINTKLRKKGYKISIPFQFTTALTCIGIGFLFLPIGIWSAGPSGYSSMGWVIGFYVMQAMGELFISPIGFAMIGQLISQRLQPLAMGTWMMATGIAATFSNRFSQEALGPLDSKNPLTTNPGYSHVFFKLGLTAIATALILLFIRPFLHRLIREKHAKQSDEPMPHNYQT